jgi:LysM repeat protein
MFKDFQIELIIRFTKMKPVNLFFPKSPTAHMELRPARIPRLATSTSQRFPTLWIGLILLICLGTLPATAQSRLSSSQIRSEVSRLSSNDQRQDLRLYNLEKDVDYLQKKVSYHPRGPSSTSAKAPLAPLPTATTYIVRPGDTVWRIAMNHRVSPGEIMQLNGLKSDAVNVGQPLKIPAKGSVPPAPIKSTPTPTPSKPNTTSTPKPSLPSGSTHTIQKGETFSQIAQHYGVSQNALKQANPQVNPNVIIIGSKLNLPSGTQAKAGPTAPATPVAAKPTTPSNGAQRHTVRPGDTLSSIASSYGVSATAVQRANTLANPDRLSIGQVLAIPSGGTTAQAQTPAPNTPTNPVVKTTPPSYPSTALTNTPNPAPVSPGPAPQSNPRGVLSYRVHSTDTLESIAATFGTTPDQIRELNRKPAGSKVTTDEEILVPAMGAVSL